MMTSRQRKNDVMYMDNILMNYVDDCLYSEAFASERRKLNKVWERIVKDYLRGAECNT